jgi:nucleoid-associated protein YgaU
MRLHRGMRPVCAPLALLSLLVFSGCGYVHFGRLPKTPVGGGDAALSTAYSNLSTEHKILKQELVLARREGDTLRVALERAGSGTASGDFVARLNETSRELATLRASYARLQAERSAPGAGNDPRALAAAKSELEEKLAVSQRYDPQLQEENVRLRTEVDRTRTENLGLNEQLKAAAIQAERTQVTVAQLNTDLLAQKEARARAEQAAAAVRAQLSTVLAQGGNAAPARETTAIPASALQIAKTPTAESSPTAELRVNVENLRTATPATPGAKPPRVHVVQTGDTLEKIARQYFGAPERWRAIYDANVTLLSNGQPLRAGMELQIPAN